MVGIPLLFCVVDAKEILAEVITYRPCTGIVRLLGLLMIVVREHHRQESGHGRSIEVIRNVVRGEGDLRTLIIRDVI